MTKFGVLLVSLVQIFFGLSLDNPLSKGRLVTQEANVYIYSYGSLEPIRANNNKVRGSIDLDENTFEFVINTQAFEFKSKLMERHVNEEYLETTKFPEARFVGRLSNPINLSENGEYPVTAIGDFQIHGVTRPRTIEGVIKVEEGQMSLTSTFIIVFEEHKIKIPTLFFVDYATQVEVTLTSKLLKVAHNDMGH